MAVDEHTVPPTTDQLAQAIASEEREADWFAAGADAGASNHSYDGYENLCRALLGMMYEMGFPIQVFNAMVGKKMRDLHEEAASGPARDRDEIGMQGRWSNDA